jgi:uncharacterized membrane protein YhaH (DUF805 family)
MSFFEAVVACYSRYADFNGRSARAEYWWFMLFLVLAGMILNVLVSSFAGPNVGAWAVLIFYTASLLPIIAVTTRRLHDTGFSGWWQLLHLTGFGALVMFVWMLVPGMSQVNRFGSPLSTEETA